MAVDRGSAISVEGLRELRKFLRSLPGDAENELQGIHFRVAQPVYKEAEAVVPRGRTGRLSRSIRVAKGSKRAAVIRAGTKAVPYAGVIHYGSPRRHIRSQPFLTGPLARKQPEVLSEYEREINRLILSVGRKTRIF